MHSWAITGCQCKMSASPLCGGFRNRRPCVCGRRMDDNRRVATKWHSGRSRGARSATSDGLARQSPSITRNSTPLRRRGSSTPLLCFPRLFIIAKTLLPASCSVFLHCFGPTPYRAGAERSRLLPPGIYGRLHACPLLPRRRVFRGGVFFVWFNFSLPSSPALLRQARPEAVSASRSFLFNKDGLNISGCQCRDNETSRR